MKMQIQHDIHVDAKWACLDLTGHRVNSSVDQAMSVLNQCVDGDTCKVAQQKPCQVAKQRCQTKTPSCPKNRVAKNKPKVATTKPSLVGRNKTQSCYKETLCLKVSKKKPKVGKQKQR